MHQTVSKKKQLFLHSYERTVSTAVRNSKHAFRFLLLLLQGLILRKNSLEMAVQLGEFDHAWRLAMMPSCLWYTCTINAAVVLMVLINIWQCSGQHMNIERVTLGNRTADWLADVQQQLINIQ